MARKKVEVLGVRVARITNAGRSGDSGMTTCEVDLRQTPLLLFCDQTVEAAFLRRIHPKPLIAMPITFGCATILYVQYLMAGNRGANLDFAAVACSFLFTTLVHILFRFFANSQKQRDFVLLAERVCVVSAVIVVLAHQVYFQMHFYRDCDSLESIRVQPLVQQYEDANCRHVFVAITVSLLAALFSITQFVRFPFMIAMCIYTLALHLVMWMFVEPPNMFINVWLNAIFVAASLAFIAYVRYDQEQVQRQQFVQSRLLAAEQALVVEQERSLATICEMLVPRSLLRRVGTFSAKRTTDESSSGTVLVVGIHDFGVWCTKNNPEDVAQGVVQLQSAVRKIATRHQLDYVGSVGDTVACVGNLCVEQPQAALNTCEALRAVIQKLARRNRFPPLRAAAHLGQLWGAFGQGSNGVRYDVFGPALELAFRALLDCPDGDGLASVTLLKATDAEVPPEELDLVATTVDGVSFTNVEPLQHGSEVSSEAQSQDDAATVASFRFDSLHERFQELRQLGSSSSGDSNRENEKLVSAELREKLERYKEVRMIWCCFPRFVDDDVEDAYVAERMEALPEAASRTWFAYGLYVLSSFASYW